MSNLKIHSINFLLLAIMFCYSCGKPCSSESIKNCEVHPLYLKYFGMYQQGNYWIYQTDSVSQIDSVYVKSDSKVGGMLNEETCEEYSKFSKVCMIYNIDNEYRLFSPVFVNENSCNEGKLEFYYNGYNNDMIIMELKNEIVSSNVDILSEMIIDSTVYNDVLHIYVDQQEYFFATEIGLISYVVLNSNNQSIARNLKSYFIQ